MYVQFFLYPINLFQVKFFNSISDLQWCTKNCQWTVGKYAAARQSINSYQWAVNNLFSDWDYFFKLASVPLILSYAPAVRLRIDFPLSVEYQSK